MKTFFKRQDVCLEVEDLRRYARILIEDLSPVLEGYELVMHLLDAPEREMAMTPPAKKAISQNRIVFEEDHRSIHLPIIFDDRKLALVTATPNTGAGIEPAVLPVLLTLIRLSLEKILLYKINTIDPETGLNNAFFFKIYLNKYMEAAKMPGSSSRRLQPLRLGEMEETSPLTVILTQIDNFDQLTASYGRIETGRLIKSLAVWLKDKTHGPRHLARLANGRLGIILKDATITAAEEAVRRMAREPLPWAETKLPPMKLAFGLASYPADLTDHIGQTNETESAETDLAAALVGKAELALQQALAGKNDHVFTFQDVLKRGGQVVQVLPYDRVVVNLGRIAGAREGQVFVIKESGLAQEIDFKGEVVLYDVLEDFSVGRLIQLRSSLSRVKPGDTLVLSRQSFEQVRNGEQGVQETLDSLLGIPDHQWFMKLFRERVTDESMFAIIIVRVDGYDRYRTTMGHLESDRQLKALASLIQDQCPSNALVARFSTESLVVLSFDMDEHQSRDLAMSWRDMIVDRLRCTCSFGVALFPCGPFESRDIVSNAQKAMEHASFIGPASVAVFNAVSLNISGDKRFDVGDRTGAIEEYRKALELDPVDVNVLNSLGVCYGYQDQLHKALESFEQVLRIDKQHLMAHFNRGFVLAMLDRPEEALESFRSAARIEPDNFDVLFQMGKMALALDRTDEALNCFRLAASVHNPRPIVFRYLGQTLIKNNQIIEAIDAFKAAVRYDPEDAPSMSQLGVLFLEQNSDLDVALSLIRQSVDLDGTNLMFRKRLARALTATGDFQQAEGEYHRVLGMGDRSRETYYELGCLMNHLGRKEEARSWFEEALKVDANFDPAKTALAELGHP
jgi:diguanylate cyclase (GGDEF)-like protein